MPEGEVSFRLCMGSNSTYSRQIQYLVAGGIALLTLVFAFGWMALSHFSETQSRWEEFNQRASVISTSLLKIDHNIGYGGFIHNFKNLVLRRDIARYQSRIESNLSELANELNRLDQVLLLPENKRQLATVRSTVDEYARKYQLALELIAAGRDSQAIDAVVKVDDGPALEAFTALTLRVRERAREAELAARKSYDDARIFLTVGGAISGLSLIAAFFVIQVYLRRIVLAHNATRKLETELSTLLDSSPDPMISVNRAGRIVRTNQRASQFFGYQQGELIGMEIETLIPERFRPLHRGLRAGFFDAPHHRAMGGGLILKALTRDGREPSVEINLSHTGDATDGFAIVAVRDVTEREHQRLERLRLEAAKSAAEAEAASDFLTGLNNRRQLLHMSALLVASANRNSTPMAVAMLDIDHFKNINDTLGHDAGDVVLKAMAQSLKERFRATDIVARYGGEEFFVVAVNIERDAAFELFDDFRKHLASHHIDVGSKKISITVSIGITTSVADNIEHMISMADTLMYQAKHEGRNRVVIA